MPAEARSSTCNATVIERIYNFVHLEYDDDVTQWLDLKMHSFKIIETQVSDTTSSKFPTVSHTLLASSSAPSSSNSHEHTHSNYPSPPRLPEGTRIPTPKDSRRLPSTLKTRLSSFTLRQPPRKVNMGLQRRCRSIAPKLHQHQYKLSRMGIAPMRHKLSRRNGVLHIRIC